MSPLIRLPVRSHFIHHLRPTRALSLAATSVGRAEGDTGGTRYGGERSADSWSRRGKASEDLYIHDREKDILRLLKEKIELAEAILKKDREMLDRIENDYGRLAEERASL